jgi:hypothetical protein
MPSLAKRLLEFSKFTRNVHLPRNGLLCSVCEMPMHMANRAWIRNFQKLLKHGSRSFKSGNFRPLRRLM